MELPSLSDIASYASIFSLPLSIALWYFTRDDARKLWKWIRWPLFLVCAWLMVNQLAKNGWLDWFVKLINLRLPVWGILVSFILLILVAIGVLWIASLFKSASETQQGNLENYQDYVQDNIFDLVWHWSYWGGRINDNFSAFCPKDDCHNRLDMRHDYNRSTSRAPYVTAECTRCGFLKEFYFDQDELYRRVGREVERRINTGEFRKNILKS